VVFSLYFILFSGNCGNVEINVEMWKITEGKIKILRQVSCLWLGKRVLPFRVPLLASRQASGQGRPNGEQSTDQRGQSSEKQAKPASFSLPEDERSESSAIFPQSLWKTIKKKPEVGSPSGLCVSD
jgi:hypothetical protein